MSNKNDRIQLKRLHEVCLNNHISFVSYRSPNDKNVVTLVQYKSEPQKVSSLYDVPQSSGFIVAPFNVKHNLGYWIEPDAVFFNDNIANNEIDQLKKIKHTYNHLLFNNTTEKEIFTLQVHKAIEEIRQQKFKKVVLSKVRCIKLPEGFMLNHFFQLLCDTYQHAFVYLLQTPDGCWTGASPEPLIKMDENGAEVVSLAGTQIAQMPETNLHSWSRKEIEEQEIVSKFIAKQLNKLGIENYVRKGPSNFRAGNLIHLKTNFTFNPTQSSATLDKYIASLHPTPSVGGLPVKESINFIESTERHKREYYTGYLGPVNMENKTQLFVNLRCLKVVHNKAEVFSGAGITKSSIPEHEWIETENKLQTMLDVIGKAGCTK